MSMVLGESPPTEYGTYSRLIRSSTGSSTSLIGVIGTAAVLPTAVALVEVGRLTRQRGQSEAAR